jgi:hypothetical protein
MIVLNEQLEARLERLEAGEALEACLAGLPEAEALLLRRAAVLRGLPADEPSPELAARQRREYLRAAAALRSPAPARRPSRLGWAVPGLALAGMLSLFVCVFVPLALGALMWLRGTRGGLPVAQLSPDATATAPSTAGTTQNPAATPVPATAGPPDAQAVMLHGTRGLVQVQAPDGTWQTAAAGQVLHAGQRLRTGTLSAATLGFYDGSQARLGPGSELSIDELNAVAAGARVIVLSQWLGESTHVVAPSSDPGARYAVNTPAGAGTAKGTVFRVRVTAAQLVRFDVNEGAVEVSHQSQSVRVVAGQSTIITADQPPSAPAFLISGEGEVQALGPAWQIAGREFVAHPNTVVSGEPRLGDWVSFEGRVIADGTRVLDKVELLRRAGDNRFTLIGQVNAIGANEWTIAGRVVRVDTETELAPGLALGAWVEVTGGIAADSAWWASSIRPLGEVPGELLFRFVGTIETQSGDQWTVGGVTVALDADTAIDEGLAVGEVVVVEGRLLEGGPWLARAIRRITPGEGAFEIAGVLESLEPLTVDGIRLVTASWTDMDDGLAVGDRVRAMGRILDDGTWLAERVERLDEGAAPVFEFAGVVNTTEPWVVANVLLAVDEATEIEAGIVAGDSVRVEGVVLPDGTWLARKIRRLDAGLGCLETRGVIARVEGSQIVLADGRVIDLSGVAVAGQLSEAMVIEIYSCVGPDGETRNLTIIILFQLEDVPATATPTPLPQSTPQAPPVSDKVTVCHRPPGNPNNAHTITIGAPAVPAHLGHGDSLGACP